MKKEITNQATCQVSLSLHKLFLMGYLKSKGQEKILSSRFNEIFTWQNYLPHVCIRCNEVFTLLHEFLRIPPDSHWKVGIPWNSMEFLWKAFGWSLSHLGFHFHGNSHFFQGILMEMVRIREPPGMIPNGIHGIPLEFRWNSMGNSFKVIVKNSAMVKNRTLTSTTHHVPERKSVLAVALCDR